MTPFKEYLQLNNLSDKSIKDILSNIKRFFKYSNDKINQDIINKFFIDSRNYNTNTLNLYKYTLRKYCEFKNLNYTIPKCATPIKKQKEILKEKDFFSVIDELHNYFPNTFLKVKAILFMMYYTGVRRGEIPLLKRENFDLKNKTCYLYHKKTKTIKPIVFPKIIKNLLEGYFVSECEKDNAFNITIYNIDRIFRTLQKEFPDLKLYPHKFRHTFATNWNSNGGNIVNLKNQLGHSSIKTTERYIGVDVKSMCNDIDKIFKNKFNIN